MTTLTYRTAREAARIDPGAALLALGRLLLLVLAAVLFAAGWLAGRTLAATVWACAAIRLGWQEGRRAPRETG